MHERSFERGAVVYDWRHYITLVERKPRALRNGASFDGLPAALQQLRFLPIKQGITRRTAAGKRRVADQCQFSANSVRIAAEDSVQRRRGEHRFAPGLDFGC